MQLWTVIMGVVLLMAPTVQAVQLCNGFAELCNRSYGVWASPAAELITLECQLYWST